MWDAGKKIVVPQAVCGGEWGGKVCNVVELVESRWLSAELRERSQSLRERLPCEFFLIRYVPDVVKGEFTNIGVLLREAGAGADRPESAVVRFTRDWSRVRCMDADADSACWRRWRGRSPRGCGCARRTLRASSR